MPGRPCRAWQAVLQAASLMSWCVPSGSSMGSGSIQRPALCHVTPAPCAGTCLDVLDVQCGRGRTRLLSRCAQLPPTFRSQKHKSCLTHMPPRPQASTRWRRQKVELYLLHNLSNIPASVGPPGTSFRLLQVAGDAPSPGLLDLVRAAWRPQLLLDFNPFLSPAACGVLHAAVLIWLQLCVLEDRLGRLDRLARAGAEHDTALTQVGAGNGGMWAVPPVAAARASWKQAGVVGAKEGVGQHARSSSGAGGERARCSSALPCIVPDSAPTPLLHLPLRLPLCYCSHASRSCWCAARGTPPSTRSGWRLRPRGSCRSGRRSTASPSTSSVSRGRGACLILNTLIASNDSTVQLHATA